MQDYSAKDVPIEDLPSLPKDLIDAYDQKRLAVFIGAGISRLNGCLGWNEMADRLIEIVCKPSGAEQIKTGNLSSKEKITIAKRLALKDEKKEQEFWSEFAKSLEPNCDKEDIYDHVKLLDTLFITTNCDGLLVQKFPYNFSTKCNIEEYSNHKDETFVFCIHGNWGEGTEENKKTLIFTADEYLEAYQPGRDLPKFLRRVMEDKTVLFIGYGLSEFEILNAAFDPVKPGGKRKHYLLEGFFKYQQELCNAKAEYYASININLVAYNKDDNGYQQQFQIISNWIDELKNKTNYNSRGINRLEQALHDFSQENKQRVFDMLSRTDSLGSSSLTALLEDLPTNPDCYKWIDFLISSGFIKPENFPQDEQIESGYKYQNWGVLFCINACLDNKKPDKQQKEPIIKFVKESMRFACNKSEILLNDFNLARLFEIALKLELIPNEDYEIALWKSWAQYSDMGIVHLHKNLHLINSWPSDLLIDIITSFFAPGQERFREHRSYWFDKLAVKITELFSQNVVVGVLNSCFTYLFSEEDHLSFYFSFEDRYHFSKYGYIPSLLKTIEILLIKIDDKSQKRIISTLLKGANSTYKLQVALHFATITHNGTIEDFNQNPLNVANSFVDFYLWLNDYLEVSYQEKTAKLETVSEWIQNADFGLNLKDEEDNQLKENVQKRVNTWKYQLFELLSHKDGKYIEKCNLIKEEDRYIIGNPLNDIELYHTIQEKPPHKYFEGVLLDSLSENELYELALQESTSDPFGQNYYSFKEIFKQLLISVSDHQVETFFTFVLNHRKKGFVSLTSLLADDDFLCRIKKSKQKEFLRTLCGIIAEIKETTTERELLLSNLVGFLQHLNKNGWEYEMILEFLVEMNTSAIFSEEEIFHEEMDTIMNVINVSESQFYILAIDTAANCKSSLSKIHEFLQWLEIRIHSSQSRWLVLACALCIRNLHYIDNEWTKKTIYPVLETVDYKSNIALCMCVGSRLIMDYVVQYCISEGVLEKTVHLIGQSEKEYRNADPFITYMVAAFYYKKMPQNKYKRFVTLLDEDNINHLVWSIYSGIRDINDEESRKLVRKTAGYLHDNNIKSKFAIAVIIYSSRKKRLNAEDWELIDEFVDSTVADEVRIWDALDECLEKTPSNNEYIGKIIEKITNFEEGPYEFTLKKIVKHLYLIEAFNEIVRLSNYAVGKGIAPKFFGQLGEHPELYLETINLDKDN